MKKTFALAAFIMATIGASAQTEVTPYTTIKGTEGVVYYLPKTVLNVKVTAIQEIYTPGEFSRYAERYLHLNGVKSDASNDWNLVEVKLEPKGFPNITKKYTIKIKDKTSASYVSLTKDGILWAINTKPEATVSKDTLRKISNAPKYDSKSFLTEDVLLAGSTAKMAELTAQEIYNIRASKSDILKGEAENMPKDGESMKFMITQLDKQEAALTQLFTGYTERRYRTVEFQFEPTGDIQKQVLFRFSKKTGILTSDDMAGEPVYLNIYNKLAVPATAVSNKKIDLKLNGIPCNVPGQAKVELYKGNEFYFNGNLPIAQFGTSEILSNDLFDKKMHTKVTFDPSTGAVLNIEK